MTDEMIYGVASVDVIGPGFTSDPGDPMTGKPYLRVTVGTDWHAMTIQLTANLAEMIGGLARGARLRWEMLQAIKDDAAENPL